MNTKFDINNNHCYKVIINILKITLGGVAI